MRAVRASHRKQIEQDIIKAINAMASKNPEQTRIEALLNQIELTVDETHNLDVAIAITFTKQEEIEKETEACLAHEDEVLKQISAIKTFMAQSLSKHPHHLRQ